MSKPTLAHSATPPATPHTLPTPHTGTLASDANHSTLSEDLKIVMHKRLGHALVLALAFAAVWHVLVRPLERSYASKLEASQRLREKIDGAMIIATPGEDMHATTARLERTLQDVLAWTNPSSDARILYDDITRLAQQQSINIERIEPTSAQSVAPTPRAGQASSTPQRARRGRASGTASPAATNTWTGRTVGHRLSVTGTYERVASFLASCERDLGATKVVSFAIRPANMIEDAPGEGSVHATIELTHLALIPPTPNASSGPARTVAQPIAAPSIPGPSDAPPPLRQDASEALPDGPPPMETDGPAQAPPTRR